MKILWDEAKDEKLKSTRGISFEDAATLILQNQIVDILKNPTRSGQFYFVLNLRNYIHAVPFLVNEDEDIVLKTIYPSRKLHKRYGRKK